MKALTLWQPYATLIAIGSKRVETRSWHTLHYEGRPWIGIHAAKRTPKVELRLAFQGPVIRAALTAHKITPADLPHGAIVAVARLVGCGSAADTDRFTWNEQGQGWFGPGRWAWMLDDVRQLPTPVPATGAQGLWTIPAATVQTIDQMLGGLE
jgi:hypothetical protein